MQKKPYWLALIALIAVGAVWIYTVGQSAGELLALLAAAPPQPVVAVEVPSEPLSAPLRAQRGHEARAAEPSVVAAEPAPRRVGPPAAELAPAVYADAGDDPSADGAEPIDHPEVTDPHLRKLLQPAWDD
jgi:hypothetical protein